MKPLSGSGARGLMVDVMTTYGVDSFQANSPPSSGARPRRRSTSSPSLPGSVNISKTRYAVACSLIADAVGLVGAITIGYLFYHRAAARQVTRFIAAASSNIHARNWLTRGVVRYLAG